MARNCNRCGKRQANRVCVECAVATPCISCGQPHGKGARAKYCAACLEAGGYPRPDGYKEGRRVKSTKQEWNSSTYIGLEPEQVDWARLAAYIDGEGSVNLSPRRTDKRFSRFQSATFCAKVVVTNTDFRLTKWCIDVFGMTWHMQKRQSDRWSEAHIAAAYGYRAAWILQNCLPWFLLKREQAEVVLEHQKSTKVGAWERGSGVRTPTDILEYRQSLKDRLTELNRRGPRAKEG